MTDKLKGKAELFGRFRYPFIILIAGVLLLLLPSGSSQKNAESDSSGLLAQVLSCSEGVGNARVLISDSGVVVVCEGADRAAVKLAVTEAVASLTGLGSGKIAVVKMKSSN